MSLPQYLQLPNGLQLKLGTSAVSVDDSESDPEPMLLSQSLVAELHEDGRASWFVGPLFGFDKLKKRAAATDFDVVQHFYVRRHKTYRQYKVVAEGGAPVPPLLDDLPDATEGHGHHDDESPGKGSRKTKERYTKAVAFEFVSEVMKSVVGTNVYD